MTFQYDDSADVLWVSVSEPKDLCVYVESQTPGVVLKVEESSGIIRAFEVLSWKRRIAVGPILIEEITDPEFQAQWLKNAPLGQQY